MEWKKQTQCWKKKSNINLNWNSPYSIYTLYIYSPHIHVEKYLFFSHYFLLSSYSEWHKKYQGYFCEILSHSEDTKSEKKGQLAKHAQHLVADDCRHWWDYFLGRDDKRFQSLTRTPRSFQASQAQRWSTSTEQRPCWERFVAAGWQSCFSTYNSQSSLIIRSKEKWPEAWRGKGPAGVVTGFNVLLSHHLFRGVIAKAQAHYLRKAS